MDYIPVRAVWRQVVMGLGIARGPALLASGGAAVRVGNKGRSQLFAGARDEELLAAQTRERTNAQVIQETCGLLQLRAELRAGVVMHMHAA